MTLTSDKSRVAVCQAAAGKPAAKISWIPASNNSSEEEFKHGNGTVTRVSYIGWVNSMNTTVTCLVTHPAMNQNLSLDLSGKKHHSVIACHHSLMILCVFLWSCSSWIPGFGRLVSEKIGWKAKVLIRIDREINNLINWNQLMAWYGESSSVSLLVSLFILQQFLFLFQWPFLISNDRKVALHRNCDAVH